MTDTTTPSTEYWPGAPAPDPSENRFFRWMRGRGIPRRNGWLGGVCSGLAARMGVDPLIVRGIFVVAAVLGLPAILIYAIGWALMPDEDGRIHLEQLVRGHFEPAMIGVLIFALVGLVPVVPLMFNRLYSNGVWGNIPAPDFIFGSLLIAVFLALVIWLTIRRARNASRRRGFASRVDAAARATSSGSKGVHADASVSSPVVGAASPVAPAPPPPAKPTDAAAGAPGIAADSTEWREQQRVWREQHDTWRRQQSNADRVARDQLRAERSAANTEFAALSAQRRAERRASNPRASGAFVLAIIGSCLVLGTGIGLFTMNGTLGAYALAIGLLVAAATAATGMILAGFLRRRSGFLAFVAAVLLALGLAAPAMTDDRVVLLGDTYISGTHSDTFLQPWGSFQLDLQPGAPLPAGDTFNLVKGTGWTHVTVRPGFELDLRAQLGSVTLITNRGVWDGPFAQAREPVNAGSGTVQTFNRTFSAATVTEGGSGGLRTVTLNLEQRTGDVTVTVIEPAPSNTRAEGSGEVPTEVPTAPTATPTEEDGA